MNDRTKGGRGQMFDPLLQVATNRQLIVERFKECARLQFPEGPANSDQFYDIVRTWISAWHQCLWHLNQVHGMKQPINDEIQFFSTNFREVLGPHWLPTDEWKWW